MLLLSAGAADQAAAAVIQLLLSAGYQTDAATAAAASRRPRCRREICSLLHREAHSKPDSLKKLSIAVEQYRQA